MRIMPLFITMLLCLLCTKKGLCKVNFYNPNNLKMLSIAKGDQFLISWNLDINRKDYLYTVMAFRHKENSAIICRFDNINFNLIESQFLENIDSIQRTEISLIAVGFELDGAIFSVENSFRINETASIVEIYDYLPIFIIEKPRIGCDETQRLINNTLFVACNVISKPIADINIGFQVMHNGFKINKTTIYDSKGFCKTLVSISFELNAYHFNKMLFISASVGKYHEMINVTITSKLPPFNVKLHVDEDNSPDKIISLNSPNNSKLIIRCSAESFSATPSYTIQPPNGVTIYEEQIAIEKFKERDHSGRWICSAKNEYGVVNSQPINIKLLEEKPSIPIIRINNIINSSNSFCVDYFNTITVSCLVIPNHLHDQKPIKYTLQMINSGSNFNKTVNDHGIFNVDFDESYHENIYTCRAENDYGMSSPAIFYLYKKRNILSSKINLMNTTKIHTQYMFTVCSLTAILVVCVIILIIKLRKKNNRILLCGFCYSSTYYHGNTCSSENFNKNSHYKLSYNIKEDSVANYSDSITSNLSLSNKFVNNDNTNITDEPIDIDTYSIDNLPSATENDSLL